MNINQDIDRAVEMWAAYETALAAHRCGNDAAFDEAMSRFHGLNGTTRDGAGDRSRPHSPAMGDGE